MKSIAENANDFVDLRAADGGNCVYVDKTDYFHRLITAGSRKLFFIARPRRFGKSLMITTFKYIFGEDAFDVSDIRHLRAVAMLYQTGYLTIMDYADGRYTLGLPDEEVRRDLLKLVAAQAAEQDEAWAGGVVYHLLDGEFEDFFDGLKALFAHLPYGSKEGRAHEMSFARMLKILFGAYGLGVTCEDTQSQGRADLVVTARQAIYVFELKRDESAAAALAQVWENGYAEPYRADGRPVWAIGLNFDTKTRQLTDAASERL